MFGTTHPTYAHSTVQTKLPEAAEGKETVSPLGGGKENKN